MSGITSDTLPAFERVLTMPNDIRMSTDPSPLRMLLYHDEFRGSRTQVRSGLDRKNDGRVMHEALGCSAYRQSGNALFMLSLNRSELELVACPLRCRVKSMHDVQLASALIRSATRLTIARQV